MTTSTLSHKAWTDERGLVRGAGFAATHGLVRGSSQPNRPAAEPERSGVLQQVGGAAEP